MSNEARRVFWTLAFVVLCISGFAVFLFGVFGGGSAYMLAGLFLSGLSIFAQARKD